eukprot:15456395-Alexandrium_andersonii.AAC.2
MPDGWARPAGGEISKFGGERWRAAALKTRHKPPLLASGMGGRRRGVTPASLTQPSRGCHATGIAASGLAVCALRARPNTPTAPTPRQRLPPRGLAAGETLENARSIETNKGLHNRRRELRTREPLHQALAWRGGLRRGTRHPNSKNSGRANEDEQSPPNDVFRPVHSL